MIVRKTLLAGAVCSAALLALVGSGARADAAEACQAPKTGTSDVPIFSPPVSQVVRGKGKVPFYSAPNYHCVIKGAFVVPKDQVLMDAQTSDGWSSVTYANPNTGNNVSGWVRTDRLKEPGSVGPKH